MAKGLQRLLLVWQAATEVAMPVRKYEKRKMIKKDSSGPPVLQLNNIKKHFGGIKALDGIQLSLYAGQVVALVGENGAGKSTAVKIMTGLYQPTEGQVLIDGVPVNLSSTQGAWRNGVTAIHQETVMFDELSIVENIFMGHPIANRWGIIDWSAMHRKAEELIQELDVVIPVTTPVRKLSVAQKHLVEIARALSHDARVVIMDEPTASLSRQEILDFYRIVERLKERGKAILFITHKFDEIFDLSDRYTVFRDGAFIADGLISETSQDELVSMMVGRSITQTYPKAEAKIGEPVLEARGLGNDVEFEDISFTLRRGEVLGCYGLVGAGRSEMVEALYGLTSLKQGSVLLKGKQVNIKSPAQAVASGLVLVPEDRQLAGGILPLNIRENITLPSLKKVSSGLLISQKAEEQLTNQYARRLSVKSSGYEQKLSELSGGNQQKVVIAKWLSTEPEIIILDEPTKGIDIGSKAAVHEFISELVSEGLAVILVSSELPEVMGMSDNLMVMHEGRITGRFSRDEFDARAILKAATGELEEQTEQSHEQPVAAA